MTPGLSKSIGKKSPIFKSSEKDSDLYQEYKMHNDTISKLKRASMRDYYQKHLNDNFKNSKRIWTSINILKNRHKKMAEQYLSGK